MSFVVNTPLIPAYNLRFDNGVTLPASGTFSRSTIATVRDHEDIYHECKSGELRFQGLRRVENLFTASGTPATQTITVVVDATYCFHIRGSGTADYALTGAVTQDPVDEGEAFTFTATTTSLVCTYDASGASAEITVQLEEISGAGDLLPGEYVDIDTIHNAEIAGVKYFNTVNGNTFTSPGPGSVTEATGSIIAPSIREGVLVEPASTNSNDESQDLTKWAVGPSGCTVLFDQIGIDGRANSATSLEDDLTGNTQFTKNITTLATGAAIFRIFVKKDSDETRFPEFQVITHLSSGVFFQLNTSTGATAIRAGSSDYFNVISHTDWWELRLGFTVTSTSGDIRIAPAFTSTLGGTDASAVGTIIVGHVSLENSVEARSPIYTTGSTVTRNADVLTMPFGRAAPWTMFQDCKPQTTVDVALHEIVGHVSGTDEAHIARSGTTSYVAETRVGADNPSITITDATASYTMGDRLKVGISSPDGDTVRLGFNGSSGETIAGGAGIDTSGFVALGIGQGQTGGPIIPITIRQMKFLSRSFSTDELERETT